MHMDKVAVSAHPGERMRSCQGGLTCYQERERGSGPICIHSGGRACGSRREEPANLQPVGRTKMPWAGVVEKQTSSFPQPLTNCLAHSQPQGG